MKRLYHTAKNKPAPTAAQSRAARPMPTPPPPPRIPQPPVTLHVYDHKGTKYATPPKDRRTEVKARERHQFTFLPCEDVERDTIRAVQHAERRKRERAMSVGDRVAMWCACLTGVYMMCRGVWWCVSWYMTR